MGEGGAGWRRVEEGGGGWGRVGEGGFEGIKTIKSNFLQKFGKT